MHDTKSNNQNDTRFKRIFGSSPETLVLEVLLENPGRSIDAGEISDSTGLSVREIYTILRSLFGYGVLSMKKSRNKTSFKISQGSVIPKTLFALYVAIVEEGKTRGK